jgi:hypothetical protein
MINSAPMSVLRNFSSRAYGYVRRNVDTQLRNIGFELDWRYLANPRSMRDFVFQAPILDGAQQKVLADLRTRGVAMVPFNELFASAGPPLLQAASKSILDFTSEPRVQEEAKRYLDSPDAGVWKEYVVRMLPGDDGPVPWGHPLLDVGLHHRLLDVVNSYLGLWSRLKALDAWYTVPMPDSGRKRRASQKWHRDPQDRRLLKVFLYLNEVDELTGPLEYVPSTRTGGSHEHISPTMSGLARYNYPPEEVVNKAIAEAGKVVCTCPPATLVFCDTSGFHRGGFAIAKPRILGYWMYVTPASRYPRLFQPQGIPPLQDRAWQEALA